MAKVLIDTSAVYALIDRSDDKHRAARTALQRLRKARAEPVVTNFIFAECHALLLSRLGPDLARQWAAKNIWSVERVTVEDEELALEIVCTHLDKSYAYTDATSFAVMKRLRIRTALAFDRHFAQFGFDLA
jgi:predicted nucleic acid-binding protein